MTDARFVKIGEQPGIAGAGEKLYHYRDMQVSNGGRYSYRLKMIDKDGTYTYSKIVTAVNNCDKKLEFFVFPNPATDQVTVKLPVASGMLHLYASDGRQVMNQKVGNRTEVMNIAHLAKGVYLVTYTNGQEMQSAKLRKE